MMSEELIFLSSGHSQQTTLRTYTALLYHYDHTNGSPARKRMPEKLLSVDNLLKAETRMAVWV